MKQSIKHLTLIFLSTTIISLPLTFLVSSCVTVNNTNSKIIIENQSPEETNVTTNEVPPKLFIEAKSNISNLKYSWFVSKDEGKNWETINGVNSSSYQIPNSEFNGILKNEKWQYKVKISLENDETIYVNSNIYKVNINNVNNQIDINEDLLYSVSLSSDEDISLSVSALSKTTKNLWYDWYLKKSNGEYIKVQHSTNSSYSLSSSDYSNIKNLTTWKSYVEIYPEGEESCKRTSITCSIIINPKTSSIVTSDLSKPETKEIINARENTIITNPLTNDGYTTVKYDEEKYIGDNSVSILLTCDPNIEYLKTYVKTYLNKYSSDSDSSNITDKYGYTLLKYLSQCLEDSNSYTLNYATGGTGWILDYSYDKDNSNLINYYLATNIHVLNATYTISYYAYLNNQKLLITATIPMNTRTVNSANIYLSQPQYSTESAEHNLKVLAKDKNKWKTEWYETSITKENIGNNLIPIGSYTSMGSPSLGKGYELQLGYRQMIDFETIDYKYMFSVDNNRLDAQQGYSTKQSSDFAVLKISEQKNKFSSYPNSGETYKNMYKKIEEMFKVNTNDSSISKKSSYIAKLNYLNNMLTSEGYDKTKVNEYFMYEDYNKNLNSIVNTVSIAGFPAYYEEKKGQETKTYVTFNSNTMTYYLRESYSSLTSRPYLEYYYNGQDYYSRYNWSFNDLLKKINLMPGSSGSMGISNRYKIIGIYWGGIYKSSWFDGAMTRLYSWTDDKSMIKIWLKYIEQKDSNSKLLALFNGLNNKSYFS